MEHPPQLWEREGGGTYCQVMPSLPVTGTDIGQWNRNRARRHPLPERPGRPSRHPLAVPAAATAWADSAPCAGAEPRLAAAPIASGSRNSRSSPAGASVLSPRLLLPGPPSTLRAPMAELVAQRRSLPHRAPGPWPYRSPAFASLFPQDCTPSTESAAARTQTEPNSGSRLPPSSSTGTSWAARRPTGRAEKGLKRQERSNLPGELEGKGEWLKHLEEGFLL